MIFQIRGLTPCVLSAGKGIRVVADHFPFAVFFTENIGGTDGKGRHHFAVNNMVNPGLSGLFLTKQVASVVS